jgi:PH domain/leucine-rich repeat-containing protein phosphatase
MLYVQNLTQLDVSENNIETLDLSALNKLECVQCSKNQLKELSLSGKALTSLIAGNNSKYPSIVLASSSSIFQG